MFFLLLSTNVFSKNLDYFKGSWLCIEEKSLGYNWSNLESKWKKITNFKLEKRIFKTFDDSECEGVKKNSYNFCASVYKFGLKPLFKTYFYHVDKSESNWLNESYVGGTSFGEFKMSEKGEFIYSAGIPGNPTNLNDKDSMVISVGSCTKI